MGVGLAADSGRRPVPVSPHLCRGGRRAAAERRRLQRSSQHDEQVAGLDGGVPDHPLVHRHRRDLGQRSHALWPGHLAGAADRTGHDCAPGPVHGLDDYRHHGVVQGGGRYLPLPPRHVGGAAAVGRALSARQRIGGSLDELRPAVRARAGDGALLRLLGLDARYLRVRELRELRRGTGRGRLSQDAPQHVGGSERSESDARPAGAGAGTDSGRGVERGGVAGVTWEASRRANGLPG